MNLPCRLSVWLCLFLLGGVCLVTSCGSPNYIDGSKDINRRVLNVPPTQYGSVAWFNEGHIALAYKEPTAREGETRTHLINIFGAG